MKHVWVVEAFGSRKWSPTGRTYIAAEFTKKSAKTHRDALAEQSPGVKWRVAKYERVK